MNAVVLVHGHLEDRQARRAASMEKFWREVSRAARLRPFQRGPLDVLLGRWTLDNSPLFVAMDMMARVVSP